MSLFAAAANDESTTEQSETLTNCKAEERAEFMRCRMRFEASGLSNRSEMRKQYCSIITEILKVSTWKNMQKIDAMSSCPCFETGEDSEKAKRPLFLDVNVHLAFRLKAKMINARVYFLQTCFKSFEQCASAEEIQTSRDRFLIKEYLSASLYSDLFPTLLTCSPTMVSLLLSMG